jgi:hypothetical protein
MEIRMEVPQQTKNRITPCDPAVPRLDIYPKECKPTYIRDICASMFIAPLFTITKLWNQPRFPITNEWIKEMWYVYR